MVKKLFILFILFFITSNLFSAEFATNFKLKDIEDKEYILSDFLGRDLILFFWTTWCSYCIRELIDLERKYLEFKSRIEFLSINVGEPKEKVKKFLKKYGVSLPVLLDRDYKVTKQYDLLGIPTYILIDKKGKIKFFGCSLPQDYLKYFN